MSVSLKSQEEILASHIELSEKAGIRTRTAAVALVTAFFVLLSAFLTSRSGNWLEKRAQFFTTVYAKGVLRADPNIAGGANKTTTESSLPPFIDMTRLSGDERELLVQNKITLRRQLETRIDEVEKMRAAATQIHLPLVGTTIDFNDLGLVGGASLLGLAIYLLRCWGRELKCLRVVFDLASQCSKLPDVYRLLEMSEVLSVPMSLPVATSPEEIRAAKSAGYSSPVAGSSLLVGVATTCPLLFCLFLGFDFATRGLGSMLAGPYSTFVLGCEVLWALLACWVFGRTARVGSDFQTAWSEMFSKSCDVLAKQIPPVTSAVVTLQASSAELAEDLDQLHVGE